MCHQNYRPLIIFPQNELNEQNTQKIETSYQFQTALLSTNNRNKIFKHHSPEKYAIADMEATGHFLQSNGHCVNKRLSKNKIKALTAENSATMSDLKCDYDTPQLPLDATEANIAPSTWAHNLISIAKFCDNKYEVLFTENSVTVTRHGEILLTGVRDVYRTHLWLLPSKPQARDSQLTHDTKYEHPHYINSAHHMTSKTGSLQYLHAACISP